MLFTLCEIGKHFMFKLIQTSVENVKTRKSLSLSLSWAARRFKKTKGEFLIMESELKTPFHLFFTKTYDKDSLVASGHR